MKNRIFDLRSCVVCLFAGVAAFSSCHEDFDFNEAYRANPEFVYKENFEKAYGVIDPEQSWDFTRVSDTRATRAGGISYQIVDGIDFDITNSYDSENDRYSWSYGQNIDFTRDFNFTENAKAQVLLAPEGGFTIYPFSTNSSNKFTLYVKIGNEEAIPLFKNEWGNLNERHVVNGSAYGHRPAGTWEKSYIIKCNRKASIKPQSWTNWFPNDGGNPTICLGDNLSLMENSEPSNGNFVIVKRSSDNKEVLYSVWNNKFMKVVNGELSYVDNVKDASVFDHSDRNATYNKNTYTINGPLLLDDYYLYLETSLYKHAIVQTNYSITETVGWSKDFRTYEKPRSGWWTSETEENYEWKFTEKSLTTAQQTALNNKLTNQDVTYTVANMPGIRINAPAGTPVQIYIITQEGNVYGHVPGQAKVMDCDKPVGIPETGGAKVIGIEDWPGGDPNGDDHNDVMLLMVSNSYTAPPASIPIEELQTGNDIEYSHYNTTASKRYMVEDLGATESSDIDFNDIVIDIMSGKIVTYTALEGGIITGFYEYPNEIQRAVVRALGGTKDFTIYVGDREIFTKSTATSVLNNTYTENGISSPLARLEVGTMYNTMAYDVSSEPDYEGVIAVIDLNTNFNNPWIPEENNVSINVWGVNGYMGELTNTGEPISGTPSVRPDGLTHIEFPKNGTVPAMIAVPLTQEWNYERISVFDRNSSAATGRKLYLTNQ